MGEQDLSYWVAFSRVRGIGAVRLDALRRHFGDLETAWRAKEADLLKAGIGPKLAHDLALERKAIDPRAELERIFAAGFDVLKADEERYPARLREVDAPPPVLYVWGAMDQSDQWAVAVVGTRRPTKYGEALANEIAGELAAAGLTVISGLARGIDGLAHQAALDAGGRSIAVLGSGLDEIYPPEHRGLARRIAANGAVVSDYPLGTKPEGRNFPPRNRIISGLALAVIVVEAGATSGALITADFAADQGREVFAVPGNLHRRASVGTNRLIQSGAHPFLKIEDVLETLNLELAVRQEHVAAALPEDAAERAVYQALGKSPAHVDELSVRCDMPVAEVNAALAMLELKGRAKQVGGMHFVRVREQRVPYQVD